MVKHKEALDFALKIWFLAIVTDFLVHIFFKLDLVEVPEKKIMFAGLGLEPWWYFVITVGVTIFVIAYIAQRFIDYPRNPALRAIVFPLIGGIVKSVYYIQIAGLFGLERILPEPQELLLLNARILLQIPIQIIILSVFSFYIKFNAIKNAVETTIPIIACFLVIFPKAVVCIKTQSIQYTMK